MREVEPTRYRMSFTPLGVVHIEKSGRKGVHVVECYLVSRCAFIRVCFVVVLFISFGVGKKKKNKRFLFCCCEMVAGVF